MKKNIFILTLFISVVSFGQRLDKYSKFSKNKKTIDLNTGITMKYIDAVLLRQSLLFFLTDIRNTFP